MAHRVPKNNFPLQGKKIVLTQSPDQCEKFEKLLYVEQAVAIRIPTIDFQIVKNLEPLKEAVRTLDQYDLLVLTSQNSFLFFQRLLKEENITKLPPKLKIAVVGEETKSLIEKNGFRVDLVPDQPKNSNQLADFIHEKMQLDRKRVLFPKSSLSNSKLPDMLRKWGAWVNDIVLYETVTNSDAKSTVNSVMGYPIDWILFSSPSAVKSFFSFVPAEDVQSWIFDLGIKIGSIGETTTKAIHEFHVPVSVESPRPAAKVFIESIKEFEDFEQF